VLEEFVDPLQRIRDKKGEPKDDAKYCGINIRTHVSIGIGLKHERWRAERDAMFFW